MRSTLALIVGATVILTVGLMVMFLGQSSLLDFDEEVDSKKNANCRFQIDQANTENNGIDRSDIDPWCRRDEAGTSVKESIVVMNIEEQMVETN